MAVSSSVRFFFPMVCFVQVFGFRSASLSLEKYLNNDNSQINGVEQFNVGDVKCWRYCMPEYTSNSTEDKFLNLLWEFDKNSNDAASEISPTETLLIPKIFTNELLNDTLTQIDRKCEKFLMLGCDIPEVGANILTWKEALLKSLYRTDKATDKSRAAPQKFDILMKTRKLEDGLTETTFNVGNGSSGIGIAVSGNITRINLQVPVGNEKNNEKRTENERNDNGSAQFERIRAQKRQTDYEIYDPKYDSSHVRFEDEFAEQVPSHNNDVEFTPQATINEIEIAPINNSNASTNSVEARWNEPLEVGDLQSVDFDSFTRRKYITIDVADDTKLVIESNGISYHDISFQVTNNYPFPITVLPRASSPDFYVSPPRVQAGGRVTLRIGRNLYLNKEVGTVTLALEVINPVNLVIQKSAYLFLKKYNYVYHNDNGPTIRYYFNNNCAGNLNSKWCSKTWWSVNIEAEDFRSGLKMVSSVPHGIYSDSDYISGTTSLQKFYYTNTCCHPEVTVKAVDVYGNTRTQVIDVREWDNLSPGEIAAIVLGAFLLLVLIILIVISVLYCLARRDKLDLPFTQRYSSRPTQRTDRTDF